MTATTYVPENPVGGVDAELASYLMNEFRRISAAFGDTRLLQLDETNVAPPKPRKGDIRLADGVHWNPGAGAGFYGYYGGAWVKLG